MWIQIKKIVISEEKEAIYFRKNVVFDKRKSVVLQNRKRVI